MDNKLIYTTQEDKSQMLMKEPTAEMLEEYKLVWNKYKDKLKPNRRTGQDILNYLSNKYILTEITNSQAFEAVSLNVTMNEPLAAKLPFGTVPIPRTYYVENQGKGRVLYENADEVFSGIEKIFVGIDLASGNYIVEGSSILWDELFAFQGVDNSDIQNYICVAQYIECLKKFGQLQNVIHE